MAASSSAIPRKPENQVRLPSRSQITTLARVCDALAALGARVKPHRRSRVRTACPSASLATVQGLNTGEVAEAAVTGQVHLRHDDVVLFVRSGL